MFFTFSAWKTKHIDKMTFVLHLEVKSTSTKYILVIVLYLRFTEAEENYQLEAHKQKPLIRVH